MQYTLSITKARSTLSALVEDVQKNKTRYFIAVKGIPVAALISVDEYYSLKEQSEVSTHND